MKTLSAVNGSPLPFDFTFTTMLTAVIGALSFSGSIIAFLKLQELMTAPDHLSRSADRQRAGADRHRLCRRNGHHQWPNPLMNFGIALVLALVLGVLFVLPIAGRTCRS